MGQTRQGAHVVFYWGASAPPYPLLRRSRCVRTTESAPKGDVRAVHEVTAIDRHPRRRTEEAAHCGSGLWRTSG